MFRIVAIDNGGQKIRTIVPKLHSIIPVLCRHVGRSRLIQALLDNLIDATGNVCIYEWSKLCRFVVRSAWSDLRGALCQRFSDLSTMTRHPNTGSVHTRAAT